MKNSAAMIHLILNKTINTMQEQNMAELMAMAFKNPSMSAAKVKKKMTALSVKNKKDLSYKKLPEYLRTPTAEELMEMRRWAIDYKKSFPKESKRQIRKAVQEHFKIRIFR